MPTKSKKSSASNTRYKWFTLILYPENPYHMEYLEWIHDTDLDFAYILHEVELNDDGSEKKPHYHVLIHFDSQRSPQAVASSLGTMPCIQDGDKFVPLYGDNLETMRINAPEKIVDKPLVSFPYTCTFCRDPHDYLHYMIHDTFASRHKKKYNYSDIVFHETMEFISSYFGSETSSTSDMISTVALYFKEYKTCTAVMQKLLEVGDYKTVEYCRKNPYFLKTFFERKGVDV